MGDVVMLAFGGGSIKRSGLYDQVRGQLEAAGKTVVDFGGIMPNPTYAKAQEGAALARERGVTDILAVGGGSVIDCCKVVAAQALLDEDIWQLEHAKGTFPTKGLALDAVVTACPLARFYRRNAARAWMHSAVMLIAISSGVSAPMARPMGMCTASMSACGMPAASICWRAAAILRREPISPT